MILRLSFFTGMLFMLSGCIGTDYVDDPMVGERIVINASSQAVMVGERVSLTAIYYDPYGIERPSALTWTSSKPLVASVDANGVVNALSAGQTMIIASFETTKSLPVTITVVANADQVATVIITSPGNKISLGVGESHTLTISVKNIQNEILTDRSVQWFSENSSIAMISNGVVAGVSPGLVDIHAKVDGVKSNVLTFSVGGGLSGSFVSAGGYKAIGMASLREVDGKITLTFSSDFETSFALGTFVYMANVTNGAQAKVNGLEVAQITTNGAKSFNLTALNPGIKLTDYKYAIILCKPASVTFGYAELK